MLANRHRHSKARNVVESGMTMGITVTLRITVGRGWPMP